MRKWRLVLTLAAALCLPVAGAQPAEAADVTVPEDVFQWVQSTSRQNYYFNKQQIKYAIGADGHVDLNTLIVPTLRTYDDVQIRDVVTKRRWKMLPMDGYDRLIGAAEYLKINLKASTVTVVEHDDLDDTFTVSTQDTSSIPPENYATLSEKDVDGCFYRAIIAYASAHREELIARTGATLSPADEKALKGENTSAPKEQKSGRHKHKKGK